MSSKHIYGAKPFTGEDSKYHYVYRITNIEENKHYYGVRSCKIDPYNDLGTEYFSSSKILAPIVKQNTHLFKFKILRCFNIRKEAASYEIFLHNKFNVNLFDEFYNIAKNTSSGYDCTGTIYITNGMNNKRVKSELEIPDGWWVGKTAKFNPKSVHHNHVTINNGIKERRIPKNDLLPEGWVLGKIKTKDKGKIWITDGINQKAILKGDNIPEGWREGGSAKAKVWVTNGVENRRLLSEDVIPEGWWKGTASKGRVCITNGKEDRYISRKDLIPEGWWKGKSKYHQKSVRSKFIWFNNGVEEITIRPGEPHPIGYKEGRLPFKWINNGSIDKKLRPTENLPVGWSMGRVSNRLNNRQSS